MNASVLVSLLASLLTAFQALLILLRGNGLCFNDGCRIVDSLTSVPPLAFNIMGFLFFQAIFWGLLLERKNPGWPLKTVRALALAGMASEGVLISFQLFITEAFCAYCLIIFALIVLLNISLGFRQITYASAIFTVVLLTFSSLQLESAESAEGISLDKGTYGMRPASQPGPQLHLFFSSTCLHCENIIETLKARKSCEVRFQPIDEIRSLDFPGLEPAPAYSSAANRSFLKSLGIEEIPVLVAKDSSGIRVLKGEQPIREYLDQNCREESSTSIESSSQSSSEVQGYLSQPEQDDTCSVSADCPPSPAPANSQQ
jgi:uncharacterized membrane protein